MLFKDINLDNIQGVLLDIDDTLYEYEICHKYALMVCYNTFNEKEDISYEIFKAHYDAARKRVNIDLFGQGASHSRFLYFQKLFESFYSKTCVELTMQFDNLYWKSFFKKMILKKDALEFLERCKRNSIKICLLTDLTAEIQFKKIIQLGIGKYIDYIVSSEEAGVEKPHPYMFKLGLEKLQINSSQAIVVGDSLSRDILGGENLNINVAHIYIKDN